MSDFIAIANWSTFCWVFAVRFDIKDFGESVGNNLCTIVALFSLYQTAFMYWVLVTLSVEVSAALAFCALLRPLLIIRIYTI
jgi:hypothetical protein